MRLAPTSVQHAAVGLFGSALDFVLFRPLFGLVLPGKGGVCGTQSG